MKTKLIKLDFAAAPVKSGALVGLLVAGAILLVVALLLVVTEVLGLGRDVMPAFSYLGVPLLILLGAPWSLLGVAAAGAGVVSFALAIAAGILLNGALIGAVCGRLAKRSPSYFGGA